MQEPGRGCVDLKPGVTRAPLRILGSHHIACLQLHSSLARIVTMAAAYKPTEAIALIRPTFVLPRIRASNRRAHIGRIAFSTTHHAQATHTSTSSPTPKPQRKSISLTGDTGQVRWSDLSPGEKAVRTTQQSFNFVVVLVGIVATVQLPLTSLLLEAATNICIRAVSATFSSRMSSAPPPRLPISTAQRHLYVKTPDAKNYWVQAPKLLLLVKALGRDGRAIATSAVPKRLTSGALSICASDSTSRGRWDRAWYMYI